MKEKKGMLKKHTRIFYCVGHKKEKKSSFRKNWYKNTVISSFVANVCSLQQQGESTIN